MTEIQSYKRKFFDSSIADILRAIDGGCLVGAFVLTLCSIAALSEVCRNGDYKPKAANKKTPLEQIAQYLPRVVREFIVKSEADKQSSSNIYRTWIKKWFKEAGLNKPHEFFLYAVRCALAHTYGGSDELEREKFDGYSMRHNHPELHWTKMDRKPKKGYKQGYVINLENLLSEYIVSAFLFFDAMDRLTGSDQATVLSRLQKQIDIYDPDDSGHPEKQLTAPKTYTAMHSALADCDSAKPTIENIRKAICSLY